MNKNLDAIISSYLEEHRLDMARDLARLVHFASYRQEAREGAPYGQGAYDCLEDCLALCSEAGLETKNVKGYCGYAQWGKSDEHVAALSHLDTVPIGDGWHYDPLGGELVGDIIYGRGTSDDKGGAITTLWAVKALMHAGFKPQMAIRLIFGCDEELGMSDVPHYLEYEKAPKYAFSPDAGFPLYHAEKGIASGWFRHEIQGETALVSLEGGTASNVVPADAWAVVKGLCPKCLPAAEFIDTEAVEGGVRIHAKGIACHGGSPSGGRNALCILLLYLNQILPKGDGAKAALASFAEKIGMELDGRSLGIACKDGLSGPMSICIGMQRYDGRHLDFNFNMRHPVTLDMEATLNRMVNTLAQDGWTVPEPHDLSKPLYVPLDHPLVKILMGVYKDCTGDTTPPQAMSGGTYARTLPCAVSFGHGFAGHDSRGHTFDENASLTNLVKAARIYAHALAQLSEMED